MECWCCGKQLKWISDNTTDREGFDIEVNLKCGQCRSIVSVFINLGDVARSTRLTLLV